MKNTIFYYFITLVPLGVLIYLATANKIESLWFVGLLLAYVIIYRTITDYLRLVSKNIIGKKDFWKTFMPSMRIKYFKALYFP